MRREERLCKNCRSGEVEDIEHVVMRCTYVEEEREKLEEKTIFCYDARPLPGPAMKIDVQLTLTDKPKLDTLNCSGCSYL